MSRRIGLGLAELAMCLLLVGCGHDVVASTLPHDEASPATPQSPQESPTAYSSGWMVFGACDGVADVQAALDLVAGGNAVALVAATVTGPVGPAENHAGLVPATDVSLLSGDLVNGLMTNVEVVVGDGDSQPLPSGRYVLLLGATPRPATYYLADGSAGSFIVSGSSAYQRCWRKGGPGEPDPVLEPVTDGIELDALASLFDTAFATLHR